MPEKKRFPMGAPLVIVIAALIFSVAIFQNAYHTREQPRGDEVSIPIRDVEALDHVMGDRAAPIQVIMFTDFECPYCKEMHTAHIPRLKREFGEDVAYTYRHLPLTGIHKTARQVAEATECVALQGGERSFWEFVDRIFSSPDVVVPNSYADIAYEVGVTDRAQFSLCMTEKTSAPRVDRDVIDASIVGVTVTPTLVVVYKEEKVMVVGASFSKVRDAITMFLEKKDSDTMSK